jgi:hypothetical protein
VDRVGAFPAVPTLSLLAEEPAFVLSSAEFEAKSAHELVVFITILNLNAKTPTHSLSEKNQLLLPQIKLYAIPLFMISQLQFKP